jgi:regulator of RNase E activity RraB
MDRDLAQFPNDDNGDVLWQMYEDGDDLTEIHEIEFTLVFQEQRQAELCALHLLHEEQRISLYADENADSGIMEWLLVVYIHMEPEHEDITDIEGWFTQIASDYAGEYDGWGCMAYVYDEDDENLTEA